MSQAVEQFEYTNLSDEVVVEEADDLIADILIDVADICRMTHRTISPENTIQMGIPEKGYNRVMNETTLSPITRKATGLNTWELRQKVAEMLLTEPAKLEEIDEFELNELIEQRGIETLKTSQDQIRALVDSILDHPKYKQAIESYSNQGKSSSIREDLYDFLAKCGFQEVPVKPDQVFYHGISLGENGDDVNSEEEAASRMCHPGKYVEKITSVIEKGINAGVNPENLPELESVFCTEDIKYAHGIAAVGFKLNPGEKLWSLSRGSNISGKVEGRHIVTPAVQRPSFDLVLRSPKFYQVLDKMEIKDIFGVVEPQKYESFLIKLAGHLLKTNLPFGHIDPDGKVHRIN